LLKAIISNIKIIDRKNNRTGILNQQSNKLIYQIIKAGNVIGSDETNLFCRNTMYIKILCICYLKVFAITQIILNLKTLSVSIGVSWKRTLYHY